VDGAGAAALKLGVSRAENAEMPLAVVRPESLHVMRRLREAQVDPGHTFSGTVSKAIEAVSPRWRPDGSRWIPTASTPISSGDEA
jgi:hypothetical protein